MHMRYALQSVVLALGEMEKCAGDGNKCYYHKALSYLREMQNFMEAIKSTPRKVGSSVTCSYAGACFFFGKCMFLFYKVAKPWNNQFEQPNSISFYKDLMLSKIQTL